VFVGGEEGYGHHGGEQQGSRPASASSTAFMSSKKMYPKNNDDFEDLTHQVLLGQKASEATKGVEMPTLATQFKHIIEEPAQEDNNHDDDDQDDDDNVDEDSNKCVVDPRSRLFREDLVVSRSETCFIMPTMHHPIKRDHCWIVATEKNSRCTMDLEDDSLIDMHNYKKAIVKMNYKNNKRTIFFESAIELDSNSKRPVIEAVPVSNRVFRKARTIFQQAMIECGSEFETVTTSGKKVLLTSPRKNPLNTVLPRGDFAYFHVEFEVSDGLVHVIEDESKFPRNFGRDTLAGLLKIHDGSQTNSKLSSSSSSRFDQQQRAKDLKASFDAFDWTPQYYNQSIDEEHAQHRHQTRETWDKPSSSFDGKSTYSANSATGSQVSKTKTHHSNIKMHHWEAALDPSSGRTYYYNSQTKESSWKKPKKMWKSEANEREVSNARMKMGVAVAADLSALKEQLNITVA